MGCCSLFDLIFGQDLKKEEKSTSPNFSLGSSHEHLLKYEGKKSPVSRSVRDYVDSSSSSPQNNGKYDTKKKLSYEELGVGFGMSTSDHVAFTRDVIRSEV